MASLYTHQDANVRKTWLLMSVFLIVVIGIGWAFSYIYDAQAILIFAVVFALFMNVFSYWNSDKIALKLTGAREIRKADNKELWNVVENLSITAGLPMPRLHIITDSAPNAFATGRDPEHASVAVTSGLLDMLNRNELEGVIAHELSHIGNRDILLSTVVVVLVGVVTSLSDISLRMTIFGGRGRDSKAGGVLMLVGIALIILSPIVATLIQLAVSRKREFLADASGALLTRYPEGLASALEKIAGQNAKMKKVSHATAHLFIANPLGARKAKGIMAKLFSTHPHVEDRVAALRGTKL